MLFQCSPNHGRDIPNSQQLQGMNPARLPWVGFDDSINCKGFCSHANVGSLPVAKFTQRIWDNQNVQTHSFLQSIWMKPVLNVVFLQALPSWRPTAPIKPSVSLFLKQAFAELVL